MGFLLEFITFSIQLLNRKVEVINEPVAQINEAKPFVDIDLSNTSLMKTIIIERKGKLSISTRLLIALAFLFQLFFAYAIMLIVMTFNILLFFAPILGMTLGFIIINLTQDYLTKLYLTNQKAKHK